jgi:Zn-finger nucleic acid-binding protein
LDELVKEIYMKCPVCADATLLMTERQSVEIDYCPTCRGVWLDRGELDKLIQLSGRQDAAAREIAPPGPTPAAGRPQFEDSDFGKRHRGDYRRKSWLSDIFD